MANPYLNFRETNEQELVEELIEEAIDIHSERFFYIPRKLVSVDDVLGEDRLSEFKTAYEIDMYLESVPNLDGQGMLVERFGSLIDYTANVVVSRRKWAEFVGRFGQTTIPTRPCEGDLLYYPLGGGLFEIKYVDAKNPYAQLGKFYTYRLTIESFQYNSEKINTGITNIDVFEGLKTLDELSDKSFNGGIGEITVVSGGKGYKRPKIKVNSEYGSGAKFKIHTKGGVITSIDILNEGTGYSPDTTEILLVGDCEEEAVLDCSNGYTVNVDEAGTGNNRSFKNEALKHVVGFNPDNPFGD